MYNTSTENIGRNTADVSSIIKFLGGSEVFPQTPASLLDIHLLKLDGFPEESFTSFMNRLLILKISDVEHVLNAVNCTHSDEKKRRLSSCQSERLWRFAHILALATAVFGAQEDAERWLVQPVMALNYHRPLDLVVTDAGTACLEEYLSRANFNVYT